MNCANPTYRCLYQHGLLLVLIFLGMATGLWQEILGPTLPSLSAKLNVSYETMGYLMSFRNVGNILALSFSAIVYDSYPFMVHYFLFAECFIAGLVTMAVPWCRYYYVVVALLVVQSCCQYPMNIGAQFTILRTFKERSLGKMQLYHLGYGIGAVISGLISRPFLNNDENNRVKHTKYCMKSHSIGFVRNFTKISTRAQNTEKGFEYIYLIAGLFAIGSAAIFIFYKCLRDPDKDIFNIKKKESWLKKLYPQYIANGNICLGLTMTVLLFLYYFFYIFGIVSFSPYIVVFAIDPCKDYEMTIGEATYLHTALGAFFLIGRVIASFILDRNPIVCLLVANTLNIGFNIVLVCLSHKYPLALWVGACGMRLCNSIVYPCGTSFVNRYIIVSSTLIALAFLGTTLGAFAGLSVGGYLVDNYPSLYITYSCLSGMVMLYVTTLSMVILGVMNGPRDFTNENSFEMMNKVQSK